MWNSFFFFFAFDLWLTCRELAVQSWSEFTWLPYAGWHSDWYSLPLQVDSFEPKCRPALVTECWTLSHDGLIGGRPACCAVPWANKTPCSLFDVTVMSRVHRLMRTSSPWMMGLTGCLCIGWVGRGGLGGFSLSAVNSGRYLTVAEAGFFFYFFSTKCGLTGQVAIPEIRNSNLCKSGPYLFTIWLPPIFLLRSTETLSAMQHCICVQLMVTVLTALELE